jgi:fluoroquinolone transport system permease protein
LVSALLLDVRLQLRSNLYGIGLFVAVLVGLAARLLVGGEHAAVALPLFYLVGIGGTTFMFGAAMLLLEKSQGTLQALRVSPLTANEYLASKAVTLTSFCIVECGIVFAFVYRGGEVSAPILLAGLLSLGLGYTLIGIGMAASHDTVTSFLFPTATVVSILLQLPFLGPLGVGSMAVWRMIPSAGPMEIMLGAFGADVNWPYAVVMSIAFVAASGVYARWTFRRHIGLREGG